MNLSLLFLLILINICRSQFSEYNYDDPLAELNSKVELQKEIAIVRSKLIHKSLTGIWKLTQESNFNLNKKKEMINQLNNKNQQYSEEVNFITTKSNQKQTEAYLQINNLAQPSTLYIELYDGKYYTDDTIVLELQLQNIQGGKKNDKNYNITLWETKEKKFITCSLIRNKEIMAKVSLSADYSIYTNIQSNQKLTDESQIVIEFSSKTLNFYVKLKPITYEYHKLVNFSMLCTLIFMVITIYNSKKSNKSVYNISQFMITQATIFILLANFELIYVCLQKIDTNLKIVIVCNILNIIMSLFFLRNYQGVFKSYYQTIRVTQGHRSRIKRSLLINKLALILSFIVAYIVLVYHFYESHNFWIYQSYILISLQIYYSYSVGGKGGMSYLLLVTLVSMRFTYYYYKFSSEELTRQFVSMGQFIQFCIINVLLIAFIILQKIFGSRFIVPKELIPHFFEYLKTYNAGNEILKEECSVCLQKLMQKSALNAEIEDQQGQEEAEEYDDMAEDSIASSNNVPQKGNKNNKLPTSTQPAISQQITGQIQIMITPCDHKFHTECLLDWMQQKLTCPNCRKDLPPSERQRDESYCF